MSIRRAEVNHIPKAELERLMLNIANLRFPGDDDFGWAATSRDRKQFTERLREETVKYWPRLWMPIENQKLSPQDRALEVVRQMRMYLRLFWKASGSDNEHSRDWYIHRAREYYYRLQIAAKVWSEEESQRDLVSQQLLDTPPVRNPIETALYHLQKRAAKPSTSPRVCPNDDCERPYFLANKKGQKFCSLDCRRPSTLSSKRNYANKNKGRAK